MVGRQFAFLSICPDMRVLLTIANASSFDPYPVPATGFDSPMAVQRTLSSAPDSGYGV